MTLTYRKDLERPLTADEVDQNFEVLDKRLTALEEGGERGGIQDILIEDGQMQIIGTGGQTFGPFALPTFCWHARGEWETGTDYHVLDVVQYNRDLFVCKKNHIGGEIFSAEHWDRIFSAP